MDDQLGRRFFLEPQSTVQRRYEALHAFFVDDQPVAQIAARLGYKPASLNAMISTFRSQCRDGRVPPFSFPTAAADPLVSSASETNTILTNPLSPIGGSWT
jgi:hypothetical protein